jgi:hypothetical protein
MHRLATLRIRWCNNSELRREKEVRYFLSFVMYSVLNPLVWRFKFSCRVFPAVLFSARNLNYNRELLYSSLFLKYMRYKHAIFTKIFLKDGFMSFLFNNISAVYLSNGSDWIDRLPCTGRKTPELCFCTRPCANKSLNSANATRKSNLLQKTACLYLIYFTRYVSAMFHSTYERKRLVLWVSCFMHFACIEDEPWREL